MDLSWFSCVMDSCGKLFQNSNGEEFQKVRTDIDIVRFIHADKIKVNYCENDCIEDDNIFRLAYRTGQVWQCIERILDMWENCEIKGQKEGADMKLGQWKQIQGLYDEEIVVPILRKVVLGNLSLWEMGREFARYKLQHVVQQAFVKGLEEETWSTCKTNYKDFATDNIVKEFFPVCKGWKDPTSRRKRRWNAELTCFPESFNAHIERAQTWFQMQQRSRAVRREAVRNDPSMADGDFRPDRPRFHKRRLVRGTSEYPISLL